MANPRSKKTATAEAPAKVTLKDIVAAGEAGMLAKHSELEALISAGHVEVNPAGADEHGMIGVRATVKGVESLQVMGEPEKAETKAKPSFSIDSEIPVPTGSARGRRGSIYPFEDLEIGQSFFLPNSEENADVYKSLSSTAASATRRHLNGNVLGKKFIVRRVEENGVTGARCWRVQP